MRFLEAGRRTPQAGPSGQGLERSQAQSFYISLRARFCVWCVPASAGLLAVLSLWAPLCLSVFEEDYIPGSLIAGGARPRPGPAHRTHGPRLSQWFTPIWEINK